MKVSITTDYGFAGTQESWEEEIPAEIVEAGEAAIEEYIAALHNGVIDSMVERLSCSVEIVE
jgi:hypothetical protein